MTADPKELVERLFGEALDLPAAERKAFVASATSNSEVAARVFALLEQDARRGGFMQTPAPAAAGPTESLHVFKPGAVVAQRYRIERRLSAGGMGEVYQAYDTKLERKIALKTILPRIAANAQAMSRFRHEVALATEVTHPNVCRVFDLGEHRDDETAEPVAFLTMQLLEGESLAERLKKSGKLDPSEALPLIRQMAEALGAAHRVGVIHRDFKPSNVMLTPDVAGGERAVVTDFGLARNIDNEDRSSLTHTDQILGTPNYMAPEQWTGQPVSAATDIYTLAIVIHEMLTGSRPGDSGADSLASNQRQTIDRCLERDPQLRPKTTAEVLAGLEGGHASAPPRLRWIFASIFVFLALVLLFLRFPGQDGIATPDDATRVTVLPFRVGDEELRVFADGLMEAVTQRLSQYEGMDEALLVTPASETRRQNVTTSGDARAKFGATHAVEATLNSEGDRLRLVLSVIDTATMQSIEPVIVEGSRGKALSLQDESVSRLASALDLGVRPEFASELNALDPVEPAAYEFYVQGLGYLQRTDRLEDIDSAISLFEHALELQPGYTLALAGLGEAYLNKFLRTTDPQWLDRAEESAEAALAANAQLPEAHIIMGRVLIQTGRSEEAVPQFEQALAISPRNGMAFEGLADAYAKLGRIEEAEAAYRSMLSRRRSDWRAYHRIALFYQRQGDLPKAIKEYEHVIALTPDNAMAYSNLGGFYYKAGRFDEARAMLEKSRDIRPTRGALTNLAQMHMDAEEYDKAVETYSQVTQLDPKDYRAWRNVGVAYGRVGLEREAADARRKSIGLAEELITRSPQDFEALANLAHEYADDGQREKALDLVGRAEALAAGDPNTWVVIAQVYVELGDSRRVKECLKRALDLGYSLDLLRKNKGLKPFLEEWIQ